MLCLYISLLKFLPTKLHVFKFWKNLKKKKIKMINKLFIIENNIKTRFQF